MENSLPEKKKSIKSIPEKELWSGYKRNNKNIIRIPKEQGDKCDIKKVKLINSKNSQDKEKLAPIIKRPVESLQNQTQLRKFQDIRLKMTNLKIEMGF